MPNNPLVSVIIPSYNRSDLLKRAISSVLVQNYWSFELIVVDDGSTDDTARTVLSFQPHVKYVKQENKGVSAARNKGAAKAKGAYLAFLDSDDEWLPEKLKTQMNYMVKSGCKISQTEETWIRNGKLFNKRLHHAKPEGDIFIPSLSQCLVTPSSVVIERSLFEKYGGYNELLPACEDYDLWLRMGVNENFGLIRENLIKKYGGHTDQLSAMPVLDKYRVISIYNLLKSGVEIPEEKKKAAAEKLAEKASILLGGTIKRGNTVDTAWYQDMIDFAGYILKGIEPAGLLAGENI